MTGRRVCPTLAAMRLLLTAAAACAALAVPAQAAPPAPSTGPFVGSVAQGETDTFTYDNNPANQPCLALAADYIVTLHGVPASDTLTLNVATRAVSTTGGTASVTITQGVCARFSIGVTGTSVAGTAHYAVTVTRSLLPPLS